DRKAWRQEYSRGKPKTPLKSLGAVSNRRGTTIRFHPDPDIFGKSDALKPATVYRMARGKAYLFKGIEIRWTCDPSLLKGNEEIPPGATLHSPGGLLDWLAGSVGKRPTVTPKPFAGEASFGNGNGRVEWAVAWPGDQDGEIHSYCNTVPTPQGGSHETGLRSALSRGLREYGERLGNRRAAAITAEDAADGAVMLLSLFVRDPQ